ELEISGPMRFQAVGIPDALHRGRTRSLRRGHGPYAPVGRRLGLALQRGLDDLLDLLIRNLRLPTAAGGILDQRCWPALLEPLPPEDHRRATGLQFLGDSSVGHPRRCQEGAPWPGLA